MGAGAVERVQDAVKAAEDDGLVAQDGAEERALCDVVRLGDGDEGGGEVGHGSEGSALGLICQWKYEVLGCAFPEVTRRSEGEAPFGTVSDACRGRSPTLSLVYAAARLASGAKARRGRSPTPPPPPLRKSLP